MSDEIVTWTEHMATREPWDTEMWLPWEDVQSSQIEALAWVSEDSSTQLGLNVDPKAAEQPHLFVRFKGGAIYVYHDVAKIDHDLLLSAESVGRAFNGAIKGQQVPFAKLT